MNRVDHIKRLRKLRSAINTIVKSDYVKLDPLFKTQANMFLAAIPKSAAEWDYMTDAAFSNRFDELSNEFSYIHAWSDRLFKAWLDQTSPGADMDAAKEDVETMFRIASSEGQERGIQQERTTPEGKDSGKGLQTLKTDSSASHVDYIESFADWLKEAEKSQNTIEGYLTDLRQLLDFLKLERGFDESKMPPDLDKADIKAYRDHLNGRQLSVKSINRKLVATKQFIDFLNECFGAKIIVKIRPEKEQQQGFFDDMMTLEDHNALMKAAEAAGDYRAKALFATLYYTGTRVSEMLQFKAEHVGRPEVRIKGKGSKYRTILINEKLTPIWEEHMRIRDTDQGDALFVGQRGPINRQTVHNTIKEYAEKAGVDLAKAHAHSFRHLFCVRLIEEGLPIDQVAKLAGHSDINTTRIYTEMTKKDYVKAINKL